MPDQRNYHFPKLIVPARLIRSTLSWHKAAFKGRRWRTLPTRRSYTDLQWHLYLMLFLWVLTLFPYQLWAQDATVTPEAGPLTTVPDLTADLSATAIVATPTAVETPFPILTMTTTPIADAAELVQQQLDQELDAFLQAMSPQERVGQLFVINFDGNQIMADSDVVELIHQYHIGSVVLTPSKENFTNAKGVQTPKEVAALTNQLQALAYGYLLPADRALAIGSAITNVPTMTETLVLTTAEATLGLKPLPPAIQPNSTDKNSIDKNSGDQTSMQIPLLIGVEQLGDSYPTTALRRNFTPLPSQLALGSTWDPALVEEVGAIVGQELSAVGINLLLGPSLDVVNQPHADPVGALGIHAFGGDPYWVSRMGSAYIRGIHKGSNNQLAAIAHHFPGQGDIDRLPETEVATVQQSLAELQRVALPPFVNVTRSISRIIDPAAPGDTVDGLMTSHMRFRAFQGAGSSRIPPISFSPELQIALEQINSTWHADGGILMTNALGMPAIRRYYQSPQQEIPYRIVALDAFVAGHDLIYLSQLSPDGDWETEKRYIKDVVQFFQERYRTDSDFQAQIDIAVRRVLRLKFNLYRNGDNAFSHESQLLPTAIVNEENSQHLVPLQRLFIQPDQLAIFTEGSPHHQQSTATISQVARASITLLYPDLPSLPGSVAAPQLTDQLLIFSDSRLFQECAECTAETMLGPEEIKSIITRLYGTDPGATGQIVPEQVYGRSFTELVTLLDERRTMLEEQTVTALLTGTVAAGITTTVPNLGNTTTDSSALPTGPTPTNPVVAAISSEEADNAQTLAERPPSATEHLQQLIDDSNWIIFAMLDVDPEHSRGSDVVKEFLRQESEQLNNKQIIVLSLNAPYFLDATEISKLTAYIGVYSKIQPFLESAIRVLFRSYSPIGAPAVSVPGTRFGNLSERLQADPSIHLPLTIEIDGTPIEPSLDTNTPVVNVGSLLRLESAQIIDHNGHRVPDGIPVQFHLLYENPELTLAIDPVLTRNGGATTEVLLTQPGRLLISASAGEAVTEGTRILSIQDSTIEAPTEVAVSTAPPEVATSVITTTVTSTTTGVPPPVGDGGGLAVLEPSATGVVTIQADWKTLLIALFTIVITLSMLLVLQIHLISRMILVKNMLWATIFGLSAYIFFALGILPGADYLVILFRHWSAAVVVVVGMLLPLLWLQLRVDKGSNTG